ncbi:MAG: class I tRNA ligase family protein [Candidatus Paceibacterota bacterium]|jgi:leucyl-tRNA synthetase
MESYNHKEIEKKWQEKWQKDNLYKTADEVPGKKNIFALMEFPYPSGNLHIGHWYAFALPDIFARTKRMQGYNVMLPIGFDAFGLPAENAAIKRGLDPKKWTYENITYMEKQLQSMGNSFDWSRKIITADPEYYKWTQWLFLQFYKKDLAYKKKASVNWCPSCQTVLANEQVKDGKCERCDSEVIQKDLEQWFFKITDYAERLISDMKDLKWPEEIKTAQRNWIGKSEGTELEFEVVSSKQTVVREKIEVFTTRADTLFGVTYLVVAPEHEIVKKILNHELGIRNYEKVKEYAEKTKNRTEIERTDARRKRRE